MTPESLSKTHQAAFGVGKAWPASDFARYLKAPNCLILGDHTCFAVFQIAGPEAELLTLAAHPIVRRQGRATMVLQSALAELKRRGVEDVFLEVAQNNQAARALYLKIGFGLIAERKNYYKDGQTAICMRRSV